MHAPLGAELERNACAPDARKGRSRSPGWPKISTARALPAMRGRPMRQRGEQLVAHYGEALADAIRDAQAFPLERLV